MSDRRIGSDDQVEVRHHPGGFGEISELRGDVEDLREPLPGKIAGARADLQANPADAGDPDAPYRALQPDRAPEVIDVPGITRPGEADPPSREVGETLPPAFGRGGLAPE